ncbi:MAG TPA: Gfo/Idh/MocA family oxidoreductase [Aggregatilineales bacterium]|nr:Gfo/Idh/MocA family oxidoreductase [Aggregatilineales bacterium]
METKIKVGIIGAGNISSAYIEGCRDYDILDLVAIADIDMPKAKAAAEKYVIPKLYKVGEMLADPDIQIVVNITIPRAHAEVGLAIIAAGKHPYSEKPLAVTREDGERILAAAKAKGVRVGCAPDTFLFGAHQTCRKLIDDGVIGEPVAAVGFMANHGPERWHPNPGFYYEVGGGPLFDMGPYYLTCLVNLLGPVARVSGSARTTFPERIAGNGQHLPVHTATHIGGVLDFASGPVATLITSFDVWGHHLPKMEVYGSEGSLSVPDPNGGDHIVRLLRAGEKEWSDIPLVYPKETRRGVGVADLAYALTYGRPNRANGELAYHVLDVMHAIGDASASGAHVNVKSTCARPALLPLDLPQRQLDSA